MDDDAELLKRYLESGAQDAFAEIVRRRVRLVYSVAFRRIGDAHRAEDATQAVFVQLARNAAKLSQQRVLIGWFYRAAYNAATDLVRSERARMVREQEHVAMNAESLSEHAVPEWSQFRPVIDEAIHELNASDRDAILMRFFDGHSFATIGERLHTTESSARMRVHRALEKLHTALLRRGVSSTAAMIGSAFAAEGATAIPSGLVEKVTTAATAGTATAALTGTLLTMKATKLGAALIALFLAAVATMVVPRRNPPQPETIGQVAAPSENITAKAPPLPPAAGSVAGRSANNASQLQLGARVSAADMADRGKATPVAALETFIWAQEGGDIPTLADVIFLTPDARAKSEKLFAGLPEAQRAQFGSPEKLIAAFMVGGTAAVIGSEVNQLNWASHQIIGEETGATFPSDPKLLPKVLGVSEAAATDPSYHTFHTNYQRSQDRKGSDPNSVFYRTDDGWRWIIPPSTIDSFSRMLDRPLSTSGRKR